MPKNRPGRQKGRPRLPGTAKVIRLREAVYNLWRDRKSAMGFTETTDSVFAERLLHLSSIEHDRSDARLEAVSPDSLRPSGSRDVEAMFVDDHLMSTPIRARNVPKFGIQLGESTMSNSFVDVTGQTKPEESRSHLFDQANNSLSGNPFSALGTDDLGLGSESSSEAEDLVEESADGIDDHVSDYDGPHFADLEKSLSVILEDLNNSDFSSDEDVSDDDERSVDEVCSDEAFDVTQHLLEESMDISSYDDERTLTMIDPLNGDTDAGQISDFTNAGGQQVEEPVSGGQQVEEAVSGGQQVEEPGDSSKSAEKNKEEILSKLGNAFAQLTSVDDLDTFLALHSRMRVMVSIDKLLELSADKCEMDIGGQVCGEGLHATQDVKSCGSRVELTRKCKNGHFKKWVSSEVLGVRSNNEFFLNDSLFAAAIIISGNNYSKFALLCKAMGLNFISSNTFTRFQKHCAAPVVKDIWTQMNALIVDILKQYDEVCLCGDGRNDSPGHSARYCVYTLMEHASKVVVDMSVIDKRETGGNSVTMEKEGLRRLLEKLANSLPFSELTTDASSSIMKLVRDMKETFPQLMELFHSLDIWHKAKKLSKCLHQAARIKGCESIKEWIDDIVNHFWFCCQTCEGSADELKEMWFGVLHHVCGDHSWAEGACRHSPEATETQGKTYLKKSSKALEALRKVVLDKKWLNNLEFYVRFRHTSVLESYNSMMTKYAPKRIAFEYPYFIMRMMLAAIDHNMHLSRGKKLDAAGNERGHRKYSKRTQKFHADVVKEEKTYHYFPFLMAKMLKERCQLHGSFSQSTDDNAFDPKQIAPTIGMKTAPPTEELMKGPSRLAKATTLSETH